VNAIFTTTALEAACYEEAAQAFSVVPAPVRSRLGVIGRRAHLQYAVALRAPGADHAKLHDRRTWGRCRTSCCAAVVPTALINECAA